MFASNPFAEISASVPPAVMQAYVVLMIVLVAAGTLFDVVHKGSATYFFENLRRSKSKAARRVGGGEFASIAVQTAVVDVLASGEFCNPRRRVAHLPGMYGFVFYVLATVVLVFNPSANAFWAQLWWIGALMICVGGYWFWFFIRVDVAAEGRSPFRLVRADLFILSLLASATLGLIWAYLHHFIAGVRHLWMDMTHSVSKEQGKSSAVVTLVLGTVLTVLLGFKLFGLY